MAFPVGYLHRVPLIINQFDVGSDLTDWTLIFDQNFNAVLTQVGGPLDADGLRPILANGADIRFSTDQAGTSEIAVDVRKAISNNNPSSGTLQIAVKIPFVSSNVNTQIWMWWGNSAAVKPLPTDTFGQYNAYDSGHFAVYDFGQVPGGVDSVLDRTQYQRHLTPNGGMGAGNVIQGQVGSAYSFDGVDDMLKSSMSLPRQAHTIEVLLKKDGTDNSLLIAQRGSSNFFQWFTRPDSSDQKSHYWNGSLSVDGTSNITNNIWRSVSVRHDGMSTVSFSLGQLINNVSQSLGSTSNEDIRIQYDNTTNYANGSLGELRFSDLKRSDDWIRINNKNQFNIAGFLTWGAIEDVGSPTVKNMFIGTTPVAKIYQGLTPVQKVYQGTNLIWEV